MLRTLAANNPLLYAGLLLLIFALHWPSFDPGHTPTDESLYLICAERIVAGGTLYLDAWEHKPPLLIWFYALMLNAFGAQTVIALRLLMVLYLFLSSVVFSQMMYNFRIVREFTLLPAVLYSVLHAVPWFALELNAEQLMALPMLLSVVLLALYVQESVRSWRQIFWVGLLCGLCIGLKYQAVLHLAALLTAFALVGRPRAPELLTLLLGAALPLGLILLGLHFTRSLGAFWDIGLLYNWDYLRGAYYPGELPSWRSALEYLKYWGGFGLLALLGFLSFRTRFYATSIRQRKLETLMAAWLLSGIGGILLGAPRFYLHYMVPLLAPLLFYSLFFLESRLGVAQQNRVLALACALPLLSWGSYFVLASPTLIQRLGPWLQEDGWTLQQASLLQGSPREQALLAALQAEGVQSRIWIADYRPELYVRLGYPCATPYTNYAQLWNKMLGLGLPGLPQGPLLSAAVGLPELYRTFEREPPACVLDPLGHFGALRGRLPLLLAPYRKRQIAGWDVYFRS